MAFCTRRTRKRERKILSAVKGKRAVGEHLPWKRAKKIKRKKQKENSQEKKQQKNKK